MAATPQDSLRCAICKTETKNSRYDNVVRVGDEEFHVCDTHAATWNYAERQIWNGLLVMYNQPPHIFRETRLQK